MSADPRLARFAWTTGDDRRCLPAAVVREAFALSGWVHALDTDPEAVAVETERLLDRLVGLGLPFRKGPEGRLFDVLEAQNFAKFLGMEGRDPTWRERFVETGRRVVDDEAAAVARAGEGPRRYRLVLRRVFGLAGADRGRAVRLRMPLPVAGVGLTDLTVAATTDAGLDPVVGSGRLEARGGLPDAATVTLGADLAFTLDRSAVSDDDPAASLAETAGPVRVTPRVRSLAEATTAGARTRRERVARLWRLLLDDFVFVTMPYERLAAATDASDPILDEGCFDCRLGGALLVALCRAIGIPARLLGGILLYPRTPVPHYWVEIHFDDDGWLPFDLSVWDLSAGGRDGAWRDRFFGRIDARMTTEMLPKVFAGAPGVAMPEVWRIVSTPLPRGSATTLRCARTGNLIYRDEIEVTRIDP